MKPTVHVPVFKFTVMKKGCEPQALLQIVRKLHYNNILGGRCPHSVSTGACGFLPEHVYLGRFASHKKKQTQFPVIPPEKKRGPLQQLLDTTPALRRSADRRDRKSKV